MPSTTSKKPQDRKPKQTKAYGAGWKSHLIDLDLPSGELCQVKRPGVQGLVKAGVLQSVDTLTSIVQMETIPTAEGKPKLDVKEILKDGDKLTQMMELVDKIVVYCVTQPKVLPVLVPDIDPETREQRTNDDGEPAFREITDDERDPEAVYIDYVDIEDKMFIMNFVVGGTRDLEQFRAQTAAAMGGVLPGEAASLPAE